MKLILIKSNNITVAVKGNKEKCQEIIIYLIYSTLWCDVLVSLLSEYHYTLACC